jgi:hypothetical protein
MSSEAAIQRGTGFIANPAFFLIFFIAGSMGLAGLATIGVSGVWGWGLTAITAVLFGLAWVTGLGERLFVGVVALLGAASWFAVTYLLLIYWFPREPLWAIGLVLFNMAAPPAAILGEKVLPLLIAFVAGIAGVLSIIVFVMVIAGIGMAEH